MQMTEHRFETWDGTGIFYRAWQPNAPASKAVILFHRGHEHSARWSRFVDSLAPADSAIFAWDQRGHGKSDGDRGCAPNLAAVIRDADCFARHLQQQHGISLPDTAVIAVSLGAVIAAAWVHDYAPPIRALILAAAAFEVKLYVPLAIPFLRLKETVFPGGKIKSFVKASMITGDPAEQREYENDPLIFREIAINMLLDLHDAGQRLVSDAGAITVPTLLLVAGNDWVVQRTPQLNFFKRLGSPLKQLEFFAAGRHALFHDLVVPQVTRRIQKFLHQCDIGNANPNADHADQSGATRLEYDLLRLPSSTRWKIMRRIVQIGGGLSEGIRLGCATGFDSGQSLDYVYKNSPSGRAIPGKWLDRIYLNAIGWRGIRRRRVHLEEMLRDAMRRVSEQGHQLHLLDIAAGPGRYVLEVIRNWSGGPVTAELRDYRQVNLDIARSLAEQLKVTGVSYTLADAFDRSVLATAMPRPSIAIVSGLYELFPENDKVRESLAGIHDALIDDGWLIYTCQPWHPQVEFIARTLNNREGDPWIMRRRTQAEMDALVRAAGFEKIDQRIDQWGIFTVALARRVQS